MWIIRDSRNEDVVECFDSEIDAINMCRVYNTQLGVPEGTYTVHYLDLGGDDGIHSLSN